MLVDVKVGLILATVKYHGDYRLVVAQRNYNEMKWKQRNLSLENGAKASVQRGASRRNSPNAYSSPKL